MDPYQVFEARAAPADCVLLIVRILAPDRLRELIRLAASLGMDALVETHAEGEVRSALDAGASLLGINNRDLDTLRVDLGTTHRLIRHVPPGITVVSESGIRTPEDIAALRSSGAHAALVGESLLRHPSPGERLSLLVRA
jgi:indole-3-glycerol phosphate synthase